jgi:hypothetical protein
MAPAWGASARYDPHTIGVRAFRRQFCTCVVSLLQNVKITGRKTATPAKLEGCRSELKPIGAAYTAGLVLKKMKPGDGRWECAIPTDGAPDSITTTTGVADDLIMPFDTMVAPVSQFEFSDEEIDDKLDGNKGHMPKGFVSSTTKNEVRIRFAVCR